MKCADGFLKYHKTIVLFGIVMFLTSCWGGRPNYYFSAQSGAAHDQALELIQRKGLCKPHCADVVLQAPMRDGFLLQTHGVTDPVLLRKIEDIAVRQLNDTPEMERVIFEAYAENGIPPTNRPFNQGLIFSHVIRKEHAAPKRKGNGINWD